MPRAKTEEAEVLRRQRIADSSRRMWAKRTAAQRARLSRRVRSAWMRKTYQEREEIRERQSAGRKARWDETPAAARAAFGRAVAEGHAQRRAEGRGYGEYPVRAPALRIPAEPLPPAPRANPVNDFARRMAAEAALPADVALTVASIAMGVGPS